jgi:hypothetical protein
MQMKTQRAQLLHVHYGCATKLGSESQKRGRSLRVRFERTAAAGPISATVMQMQHAYLPYRVVSGG